MMDVPGVATPLRHYSALASMIHASDGAPAPSSRPSSRGTAAERLGHALDPAQG